MTKRRSGALALLAALLVLWMGLRLFFAPAAEEDALVITALSVGKADALVVQQGGQALLIDAGEEDDGDDIVRFLRDRGIDRIDLFLVTHFDKDHVGGAARVVEQMEVSAVRMPDYEGERPEYRNFLEALSEHPDVQRVRTSAELFSLGELQVTVYPAADPETIQDTEEEYDNDLSLVTSIRYRGKGFLLTGDIEKERIRQMLSGNVDWNHDWIKMPHHGRYQKALEDLLNAVSPEAAVICCSNKNPAEEKTLSLLEEKGIPVWDTRDRNVVTICDGEHITVKPE